MAFLRVGIAVWRRGSRMFWRNKLLFWCKNIGDEAGELDVAWKWSWLESFFFYLFLTNVQTGSQNCWQSLNSWQSQWCGRVGMKGTDDDIVSVGIVRNGGSNLG